MRFTEKSTVEDYFISQLVKLGWTFIPADEFERESAEEPLLLKNLVRQIRKINKIEFTDDDIKNALNELMLKPSTPEGIKQVLHLLKEGISIKLEKQRTVEKIALFDYGHIKNNEFIVTRQISYVKGGITKRPDIILYVNGIPLVDIECKNPASFSQNWFDAYKQIKEYEKVIPEVYKYVQIGVAAEQAARYFAIVPWEDETKTYEWKAEVKEPVDAILTILSPDVLLDIMKNFIFYRIEFGNATKVITRYMQYRASNKVVIRVENGILGKETKNKGLIWHWQGSGKTLEMIFAANKLYNSKELENPTIFFIVDREDLEEQLYDEFNALDIAKPEIIASISDLKRVIKHDEGRGKRGLLITLIHKFRPEELDELQKELETLPKERETILNRKNVIAFIDEAHRTQYGTLAAQMRNLLRNTFFFAFTGTPISKPKKGIDTYQEFSYPPEERYLDKYFITDSINDGFTVKIAYQPRLDKEVHLNKELLDTFLEVEYEELPEEFRESVKEEVRKKISLIKVYLENPERIRKVCKDIAEHFKNSLDGKFKAMVVAVNRNACVHYKNELDKLLPTEYSEIVMTYTERKDTPLIEEYRKKLVQRFNGKEIDDIKKEIIEKYTDEPLPKILIVTDMLLTGFDAPILQTMYLDKPLKEHRLLQAIARTNRPYKDVKEAGLIIDYVGILREFRRAFEIYSKEEINGALFSLDDIKKEFSTLINEILEMFKEIPKDKTDLETLRNAVSILTTEEDKGKEFLEKYRHLQKIFELLGSDVIKAQLFSQYSWITAIYVYYLRQVHKEVPEEQKYVKKYFDKTIKIIHKSTQLENIEKELPIITFDVEYLKKLEEKVKNKEEKAANIVFTLNRFILVDKHTNPVTESVTEKVERLLKLWKQKTKDYEQVYKEGVQIIQEYDKLTDRQKKLQMTDLRYALLLSLEDKFGQNKQVIDDVTWLSNELKDLIFPGWQSQVTIRKNVERVIRVFIRQYVKRYQVKLSELEELYKKLLEVVKYHAEKS